MANRFQILKFNVAPRVDILFVLSLFAFVSNALAGEYEAPIGSDQELGIEFVRPVTAPPAPYSDVGFTFRNFTRAWSILSYLNPEKKNKFMEQVDQGFARLQHAPVEGHPGYQLVGVERHLWTEGMKKAYERLNDSPIFRESMKLKTQAREIVLNLNGGQLPDIVDQKSNPLYLMFNEKDEVIWGVGPQLTDGIYYSVREGRNNISTNDVLVMEPARQFGVDVLDNDSLSTLGYLNLALAHENGHAIMQEAYGMKAFAAMTKRSYSGIGHDVNIVSNRRLAYLEGWAEAFEAYFSEKYARSVTAGRNTVMSQGIKGLLATMYKMPRLERLRLLYSLIRDNQMPNLVAGHLQSTRGTAIREDSYLTGGENLDTTTAIPLIWSKMMGGTWEEGDLTSPQQNLAKEGVVAYEFYRLLKAGRFKNAIHVFVKHKPTDYEEFYLAYIREYPEDRDFISRGFYESFHRDSLRYQRVLNREREELTALHELAYTARDQYVVHTHHCTTESAFASAYQREFPGDQGYVDAADGFTPRGLVLTQALKREAQGTLSPIMGHSGLVEVESRYAEVFPSLHTAKECIEAYLKIVEQAYVRRVSKLKKVQKKVAQGYELQVRKLGYPVKVDFGPELWFEFRQRSRLQRFLMGYEGEMELNTATPLQIQNFIYSARYHESGLNWGFIRPSLPTQRSSERDAVLQAVLDARDNRQGFVRSIKDLNLPGSWYQNVFYPAYRPYWK